MRRAAGILFCLLLGVAVSHAGERVRHGMTIELDPAEHRLDVTDRVELPPRLAVSGTEFLLNAKLTIVDSDPPLRRVEVVETQAESGVALVRYRLESEPRDGVLVLAYSGAMDYGLSEEKEQYTRGFRETHGLIGEEGVFLDGGGVWYPQFDDELIEFRVDAGLPAGWHVVSQGDGVSRDEAGWAHWETAGNPMEEIYLCGGPLVPYRESAGAVEALVFLREADDGLASKYLSVTAQYLEMYRELIGPYPYGKFALVENFWETGFGMPSFTLLGPTVIRFPFILHSSYPHEILHNWWGNSVFVDYDSGNWCEGLTAYMADHLVQEQRGKGAEYRRGTLQRYRDYVREGRDFPLAEFRSRHSAATEAVGYGKSLMGFHMLRRRVGDDGFRAAMARFYREQRGRRASFRDLQGVFEAATGEELEHFFDAWIESTGAAELRVEVEGVREVVSYAGGEAKEVFLVRGVLRQVQDGDPFPLDVPVVIQTESGMRTEFLRIDSAETKFSISLNEPPLLLQVDPWFDLFRLLDPRETPPSIGQLFGEPGVLAVLPADAPAGVAEGYRALLEGWRSDTHEIAIELDSELEQLPADRAVWIVGGENRFAERLFGGEAVPGLTVSAGEISLGEESVARAGHSIVAVRRHPGNVEKAIGWIVVEPAAALAGMGRKLPHYGKYSYLAFEGDEPANVIKGQWPAAGSPLRVDLRPPERRDGAPPAPAVEDRAALAELPPVFSERALAAHVDYLASSELEGRAPGSEGLLAAASYIAEKFEAAGLLPGGDDGGWLQRFVLPEGPEGEPVETFNVIGYLPGSREEWREQSVVLGAHYDHLGRGWPDVHAGDEGKIHPGADDNASGVAVLIELAVNLAAAERPQRNLVFAAFSAEEAGRVGSIHFVERSRPFPTGGIRAMINLDTVGRLGEGPLTVLSTATAGEWPHIFRGCSYVTGVESRNVSEPLDSSDQMSFIERGIPAVQLFTRAHTDYHRPGDSADRVDAAGLVKVATFVKEAVVYLTEREEPLSVTIEGASQGDHPGTAAAAPPGGRRVSFGVVPEFGFAGPGVQLGDVVPGSPAEAAGLRAGDVLLRIDGTEIAGLREFSNLLRALEPGQRVEATLLRDGEEFTVPVTVEER